GLGSSQPVTRARAARAELGRLHVSLTLDTPGHLESASGPSRASPRRVRAPRLRVACPARGSPRRSCFSTRRARTRRVLVPERRSRSAAAGAPRPPRHATRIAVIRHTRAAGCPSERLVAERRHVELARALRSVPATMQTYAEGLERRSECW